MNSDKVSGAWQFEHLVAEFRILRKGKNRLNITRTPMVLLTPST